MSFTDDDLKRLKDGLNGPESAWFDGYTVKTVLAFLARLEAAENSALDVPALCKEFDYCEEMDSYSQMSLDALERHKAWLRSCGKGEK
jgi:hypothetical protein